MARHPCTYLLTVLSLLAACGAGCPMRRQLTQAAPVAYATQPTLAEIINAVNNNSGRVQQLQAERATVSVQGVPALRADLALERPRRFRMRAELLLGFGNSAIDIGSNEDVFWVRDMPGMAPAIYFARHSEFHRSAASQVLPVEPYWLVEALGVVSLDPLMHHEGPFPRGANRYEVRSRVPTDDGRQYTKVTVVDDQHGWVMEQHVYNDHGHLLASAQASRHRYHPAEGVSLPMRVEIQLPPAQMSFQVDIGSYAINQLVGDPAQLWALPQPPGYPLVNMADPSFRLPMAPPPTAHLPAAHPEPRSAEKPRRRGFLLGR